jgi:hypothetical protein
MVRQQRPTVAGSGGFLQNTPKPFQKTVPVTIINEYLPTLYASHNNVLKSVWGVDASLSWHEAKLAQVTQKRNL